MESKAVDEGSLSKLALYSVAGAVFAFRLDTVDAWLTERYDWKFSTEARAVKFKCRR
jgi:hypothetical protein